jgi:hypothetical protein
MRANQLDRLAAIEESPQRHKLGGERSQDRCALELDTSQRKREHD